MAQNPNFESRCKPKTAKETDQYFNKQNLKSDKDTNDPFDNIMKFDQDGELIIEFEDSIFNIEEEQLSTPIEDDFEYEILVDDNSSQSDGRHYIGYRENDDEADKYFCPETGAHFEFDEVVRKLK